MNTSRVEIDIPEEIIPYVVVSDESDVLIRNTMTVYPYIQNGSISHGKAVEMLGIGKQDLIVLYGNMGLVYIDESVEEIHADIEAIKSIR